MQKRADLAEKSPGALRALLAHHQDTSVIRWGNLTPYVVLFIALAGIYSFYLRAFLRATVSDEIQLNLLSLATLRFVVFTGAPFAVIAYFDEAWRSEDGAIIALCTFFAAVAFWFPRYGLHCAKAAFLLFIPFVVSAAIGHTIGSWRRPWRPDF